MVNNGIQQFRWGIRAILAALLVLVLVAVWSPPITRKAHLLANLAASYFIAWLFVLVLSTVRPREVLIRGILSSFGIIIGWLIIELFGAVGFADYPRILLSNRTPIWCRLGNCYHPEMQFYRRPSLTLRGQTPGNIADCFCLDDARQYEYELKYDAHGFRNPVNHEKADVVVLGDSYIEGIAVKEEELMTSIMARETGLEVVNLGLAGYGPRQELASLELVALQLNPRVVVWSFYEGNDFYDIYWYNIWAAMGRPTGGLDAQNKSNPSFLSASLELGLRLLCRNKPEADQNMAYFRNKDGSYTKNYFMEATPRPGSEAFWGELTDIFRRAYDLTQAINAQLIIVFPADKVSRPSEFHKCAGRFNSKPVARL